MNMYVHNFIISKPELISDSPVLVQLSLFVSDTVLKLKAMAVKKMAKIVN